MTNQEIKNLFEKKKNKNYLFVNWVKENICTENEMILFKKWPNQLNDEELFDLFKKDHTIFSAIENKTEQFILKSIEANSWVIGIVSEQAYHFSKLAISRNPLCLKSIKIQSVDLCLLALKQERFVYRYVRIVSNPDFETTLKNLKEKKEIIEALK